MSVPSFLNENLETNSHMQDCAPAALIPVLIAGISTQ
jgi:hypothetical protein